MLLFDFAMHRAGQNDMKCNGNFAHALTNTGLLTGKLLPLFGKLAGKNLQTHLRKLQAVETGSTHEYALHPVFVSIKTDYANDAGAIVLQGVCVSPLAFNHPVGHERRLRTGLSVGQAFDDTWIVLLVTHAYVMTAGPNNSAAFPGIPWSAINPCSVFAADDDDSRKIDVLAAARNQYNAVFQWNEYMAAHRTEANAGVTPFALNECKQIKNVLRKLLEPGMTLSASQKQLKQLRDAGQLQTKLANDPATLKGLRRPATCGNDLRKGLLAECLLAETPLQGALTGDASRISLPEVMPDAAGFFGAVRTFLDDYRDRERTLDMFAIQTAYEAWFSTVFAAMAAAAASAPAESPAGDGGGGGGGDGGL
jgi:hypothetical protein